MTVSSRSWILAGCFVAVVLLLVVSEDWCGGESPAPVVECIADIDCADRSADACGGEWSCLEQACVWASDCDDGLWCNGPEQCDVAAGGCTSGESSCSGEVCDEETDTCTSELPFPPFPEPAREATRRLIEAANVSPEMFVSVFGPVPPGTRIRGEYDAFGAPPELAAPSAPGPHYLFFIDERPMHRFEHPVRYGLVSGDSGPVELVEAAVPPILLSPGADEPAQPFAVEAGELFDGVLVLGVTGQGEIPDDGIGDPASPGGGAGPAFVAPGSRAGEECARKALVLDLGDKKNRYWFGQLVLMATGIVSFVLPIDEAGSLADNFHENAEQIAGWVEAWGFTVERRSNWRGQDDHAEVTGAGDVVALLEAHQAWFEANPPDGCCHEFFLYLSAHGTRASSASPWNGDPVYGGLSIFSRDGTTRHGDIRYSSILAPLMEFPNYVKITVFVDACHSGQMVQALQPLADGRCGLTLLATCTADETSPGGQGPSDTCTDMFMAGAGADKDGDGAGDLFDRFVTMVQLSEAGESIDELLFHVPDDLPSSIATLCSLDSPVGAPPAYTTFQCGDGTIQWSWGEECDTALPDGGGTCPTGHACNRLCKCEPTDEYLHHCGDGTIQGEWGEECDPGVYGRGGCPRGEVCNQRCRCEPSDEPPPSCDYETCRRGCCTEYDVCRSGTANDACGIGGNSCADCSADGGLCDPRTRACVHR